MFTQDNCIRKSDCLHETVKFFKMGYQIKCQACGMTWACVGCLKLNPRVRNHGDIAEGSVRKKCY